MERKLKEIVAEVFKMKNEEITDSLAMKETAVWSSLKHMELIVSIEESFGIELTFDEIVAMKTYKEIRNVLKAKGLGI